MKQLVFIHGRAQEGKDALALKAEWIAAWKVGLAKNGLVMPIPEDRVRFRDTRDDGSTLDAMRAMLSPLEGASPLVGPALALIASLRARCDRDGRLPDALQPEVPRLVAGIESALS